MNLVLGVTGSVAAILIPTFVDLLTKRRHDIVVKVVVSKHACYFFDHTQLPVVVMTDDNEWSNKEYSKGQLIPHIDLGEWADKLLIAPLSANTLSDIAHGKSDTLLTGLVLAYPRQKPMIVAPAMNTRMWENPITQNNLATLKRVYTTKVAPPREGKLACKTVGIGAMANISTILNLL